VLKLEGEGARETILGAGFSLLGETLRVEPCLMHCRMNHLVARVQSTFHKSVALTQLLENNHCSRRKNHIMLSQLFCK
jgi:hypothetical protein